MNTINDMTDDELQDLFFIIKNLSKRDYDTLINNYDVKSMYHCARLALQCEQILEQHDMDCSANSDFLKSIRNGVMTLDEAKDWYKRKEEYLDRLYTESTLRHKPDRDFLKKILLSCLEIKYGSLSNILKVSESENSRKLEEIKRIINS